MFYSDFEIKIKEMINMQYQDALKRSEEDRLVNGCRSSGSGRSILSFIAGKWRILSGKK